MEITEATYVGSFPSLALCPADNKPEYAFIGRSNVGKSSLINMLCGRKDLAHVSKKPGKTRALNYYLIDRSWYLVDLPGYGYAVAAKKNRRTWNEMTTEYFLKCPTLQCAFVLIDANVPPQKKDIDFINWLGEVQVPFVIAYTKTDRLSKNKQQEHISAFQQALSENWNTLPQQFITSSLSRAGRQEILDFIGQVNQS